MQEKTFSDIIKPQVTELIQNGYDELSMRGFDRPGAIMQQLEENLSVVMLNSLTDEKNRTFSVPVLGAFNHDRDIVSFKLHYLYTPDDLQLRLYRVEAMLRAETLDVKIKSTDDLPSPNQLYGFLLSAQHERSKLKGAATINEASPEYEAVASGVSRLFTIEKAYFKSEQCVHLIGGKDMLQSELLRQLWQVVNGSQQGRYNPYFVIRAQRKFNDRDTVQLRLLYRYGNEKQALEVTAINVRLRQTEKYYQATSLRPLPSLQAIYEDLSLKNMVQAAKLLNWVPKEHRHRL